MSDSELFGVTYPPTDNDVENAMLAMAVDDAELRQLIVRVVATDGDFAVAPEVLARLTVWLQQPAADQHAATERALSVPVEQTPRGET